MMGHSITHDRRDGRFLMEKPTEGRRKLVEFDAQTWHALNLLSRESMKTLQELADEAFRDLLNKYRRPTDLKAALRESAQSSAEPGTVSRRHARERREADKGRKATRARKPSAC